MNAVIGEHERRAVLTRNRSKPSRKGRKVVDDLVRKGRLRFVVGSQACARAVLDESRRHMRSALIIARNDPAGGYLLACDAAFKAFNAFLEAQGLRTNVQHCEAALYSVIQAQLAPRFASIIRPYNTLCVRRNELRHPESTPPPVTKREVEWAVAKVASMVTLVERLVQNIGPDVPKRR